LPRDLHPFPTRRSSDLDDAAGTARRHILNRIVCGHHVFTCVPAFVGVEKCAARTARTAASLKPKRSSPFSTFTSTTLPLSLMSRSEEHTSELQSPDHLV